MNVTTFDKLAYIDSLKANGVAEDQARAHAAALDAALHEAVATKADLADVKVEMMRWLLAQTALLIAVMAALKLL